MQHTRRHIGPAPTRLLALLLATLLCVPAARADGPANPLNRDGSGAGGNTAAAQAPPPSWVVPGARITERTMFSNAPKEVKPEQPPGQAGTGFVQYDIVAVTPAGVVMEMRSYDAYQQGQRPELNSIVTVLQDSATGGGLWMHPDAIAATQTTQDDNSQISREVVEIDGESYETLIFLTRQGNTTTRQVFDIRTGVRLAQSALTEDAQNRSHHAAEYAGYRVAELPWQGTEITEQVQSLQKLEYSGDMVYIAQQHAGFERLPDLRISFDAEYTFFATSAVMIGMEHMMDVDVPEGPNQTLEKREPMCPGQRMGLFIHPDVLSRLEDGQVLDEDPAIGYEIVVTDVYQVDGVTLVEITERGPGRGYYVRATYDARVGLQVASEWSQPAMNYRVESQLERVE